MWEKKKLLVTSNFFFSHIVFKRLVLQTRKNQGLFGKGLLEIENLPDNMLLTLYSLPNDNILYLSKWRALADNKLEEA